MPTYDFEGGTIDSVFRNDSDNPWVIDSTDPYAGTYCIKSGNAGVNHSSSYLTAIIDVTTAGTMSCRWGVEGEIGYDKCAVIIDGVIQSGFPDDGNTLSYSLFTSASLAIGPHIIQFMFTKDESSATGKDAMYLDDIVLPAHTDFAGTIEDFSGGIPATGWTNGSNPWAGFTTPHSIFGSACLRSDNTLGNSQTSDISYTVDCDAGDMFFAYRVSSEVNYDFLKFYVDGTLKLTRSGKWPAQDIAIGFIFHRETVTAGSRTFKWEYSKDSTSAEGEDNGYLDALYVPAASGAVTSELTSGSFNLTGSNVGSLYDRVSDISSGAFNLTGSNIGSLLVLKSVIDPGSYALTGANITGLHNQKSDISSGSFALTGGVISGITHRISGIESGTFALAGQNISTLNHRTTALDSGTFALTGSNIDTIYDAGAPTIEIEPGAFVLTGQNVTTLYDRLSRLDSAAFALTGANVSTLHDHATTLESGAFVLTGQNIDTLHEHLFVAESGAFVLTGSTVDTTYDTGAPTIEIEPGSFVVSGSTIDTLHDHLSRLESGSFAFTGQNIDTAVSLVTELESGSFVLTGSNINDLYNRISVLESGSFVLTGSNVTTGVVLVSDSIIDIQLIRVDNAFSFIQFTENKINLNRATTPITLERVTND